MSERGTTNDFPKIGINTMDLIKEVEHLLDDAANHKSDLGAVNWGDLGIADIEYRLSVLNTRERPRCVVVIEEASPNSLLASWLYERLDKEKFPNTYIECEW